MSVMKKISEYKFTLEEHLSGVVLLLTGRIYGWDIGGGEGGGKEMFMVTG